MARNFASSCRLNDVGGVLFTHRLFNFPLTRLLCTLEVLSSRAFPDSGGLALSIRTRLERASKRGPFGTGRVASSHLISNAYPAPHLGTWARQLSRVPRFSQIRILSRCRISALDTLLTNVDSLLHVAPMTVAPAAPKTKPLRSHHSRVLLN